MSNFECLAQVTNSVNYTILVFDQLPVLKPNNLGVLGDDSEEEETVTLKQEDIGYVKPKYVHLFVFGMKFNDVQ